MVALGIKLGIFLVIALILIGVLVTCDVKEK